MVGLVQQAGTAGNAASATVTFGQNFTAGNFVIIGAEVNSTNPVATTTGVVYTRQNEFTGDASHDNTALWTGVVGTGATNTISITGTLNAHAIIAVEFSGNLQLVDGTPPTPTNLATATPSVVSNTPSVTAGLAIAFCGHTTTSAPTVTPTNWTSLTRQSSTNSIEGAYKLLPGDKAAVTPQWTFSGSQFALMQIVLVRLQFVNTNSYEFAKADSGMSVTEKIR